MSLTEFRPVPGYEGVYEVNATGAVWSIPRVTFRSKVGPRPAGGQFMTPALDRKGYQVVYLRTQGEHRGKPRFVHQLVAEAFHGPRPDGAVTRHLNGDKTDNRASNLAHGTHQENNRDTVSHGTNVNAGRRTCPMGHGYTEDNVDPALTQARRCLECGRERNARRRLVTAAKRSMSSTMERSLAFAGALHKEAA